MYSQKPIPKPFRKSSEKASSVLKNTSCSIEASEKEKMPSEQASIFPLAALFFLDLLSAQKKKG